jgi:hypothetical protein
MMAATMTASLLQVATDSRGDLDDWGIEPDTGADVDRYFDRDFDADFDPDSVRTIGRNADADLDPTADGTTHGTADGATHGTAERAAGGAARNAAGTGDVGGDRVARLADLRAAGMVRRASERTDLAVEQSLPVSARLRPLLSGAGGGGLRRGGTFAVAVTAMPRPVQDPRSAVTSRSASTLRSLRPGSLRPLSRPAPGNAAPSNAVGNAVGQAATGSALGNAAAGNATVGNAVPGATSLLLALVAEATAAGSWCAVVGLPQLGLVAAAEAGVAVERLALVPYPGPDWTGVVAALLDGVDIVVVATPGQVSAQVASRLTARARQRGAVLVPVGRWPGADLILEVAGATWHGLGLGRGRLRARELSVVAHGRGAATRPRRVEVWLPDRPAPTGEVAPAVVPTVLAPVPVPVPVPMPVPVLMPALGLAG